MQSRINELKNSSQLTEKQAKELENKLKELEGLNRDNKLRLDIAQKHVNTLLKKNQETAQVPGHRDKKDWNSILTQDAFAVLQAASQGNLGGGRAVRPERLARQGLLMNPLAGGGVQGLAGLLANPPGGGQFNPVQGAVLKLLKDYTQAKQDGAQLKPETIQLVQAAFQAVGINQQQADQFVGPAGQGLAV